MKKITWKNNTVKRNTFKKGVLKKNRLAAAGVILAMALLAAGCAGETGVQKAEERDGQTTLKIGVCAGPYGDMFTKAVAPYLEEKGYKTEIVEFTDYVQPDMALAELSLIHI